MTAGILFPELSFCMLIGIVCNVSGSTGDIFLLTYIIKKRKLCKGRAFRIKDEEYGFGLYTK